MIIENSSVYSGGSNPGPLRGARGAGDTHRRGGVGAGSTDRRGEGSGGARSPGAIGVY